jgi:hypothetical protein
MAEGRHRRAWRCTRPTLDALTSVPHTGARYLILDVAKSVQGRKERFTFLTLLLFSKALNLGHIVALKVLIQGFFSV